ncbi:MAG: PhoH family protein [Elusimicrobiales bacterium]|nr:PhoH family protein [Elusimicrobiales bacterium]
MTKTYILDTNVLLHDVNAVNNFKDNDIIIPIAVIEELDGFKSHGDELGKNARLTSRRLDELRKKGKLSEGVKLENGGTVRITLDPETALPHHFMMRESDNRIISTAYSMSRDKKSRVIIVSKDINLRLKAEAVGIEAQDYEAGKVKVDEFYTGTVEIDAPADTLGAFYKEKSLDLKAFAPRTFYPNQFVVLRDVANPKHTGIGRVYANEKCDKFTLQPVGQSDPAPWGIKPLNKEQRFAMELLLDDSVSLVTLVGNAGTGKTLISLAAGLQRAIDDNVYRRLIICRSIVPVGKDIGFLPGSKEEKLGVWMGAIYDNLEFLSEKKHPEEGMEQSDYLVESGKVEIASVTHIRGRTLPKQYMIVDDAQNLTPHEVKTILSRAGEGTKVVVTGDPHQIDSPYLDIESNGLTYIVDRFKGQRIYGHITFTKTERSSLAALVAELL